jgi:hypothetical protein
MMDWEALGAFVICVVIAAAIAVVHEFWPGPWRRGLCQHKWAPTSSFSDRCGKCGRTRHVPSWPI